MPFSTAKRLLFRIFLSGIHNRPFQSMMTWPLVNTLTHAVALKEWPKQAVSQHKMTGMAGRSPGNVAVITWGQWLAWPVFRCAIGLSDCHLVAMLLLPLWVMWSILETAILGNGIIKA